MVSASRTPMIIVRKLRIAFSATCRTACVLLIALWVRSYWWSEYIGIPPTCSFGTTRGDIVVAYSVPTYSFFITNITPGYHKESPIQLVWSNDSALQKWTLSCVRENRLLGFHYIGIRIYAMLAAVSALGTAPWLRWRFSLRTLLIAATLIAVVLGLTVYFANR